jgi:hypothetical protein
MPYTNEEIVQPFWAEYSSTASGRDPLAIQNSSVVIYTKMMVGITNVTNRIRYTGFYCWMLDTILKNIPERNSLIEQVRYIRRAELLMAYMMVNEFEDATGISGSDYAGKHNDPEINLRKGADWDADRKSSEKVYWKFKEGAFGQYYKGVVRELNLINHPQGELNIYTLTTKGQELAVAFNKNILSDDARKLFWESVFKGSITKSDLPKLKEFALHVIPIETDELHFYENMLLSHDDRKLEPTYRRQQTIKLLLDFLSRQEDGIEKLPTVFLRDIYGSHFKLTELPNDTATAWYLYEINELLHVSFEHFHTCFLYSIEAYPTSLDESIESLIQETKIAFQNENIDIEKIILTQLVDKIAKEELLVYDYYDAMEKAYKVRDYGTCLFNSIHTLLIVFNSCKKQLSQLNDFGLLPENNFIRRGNAIELIEELIDSKLDLSIYDYTKYVLLMVINLHTFSSYSKTKVGQSLVHNYMIEDDTVWRLRKTLPNRTTPRLQNAIQYITDIGWLEKDGKSFTITDAGIKIIKS